jgi:flavodoxin
MVMNVLVLYESVYGNTAQVARAVAGALGPAGQVELRSIAEVETLPSTVDLLVIGGPTYAHGVERSMRAFLDELPAESLADLPCAAFDTRLRWPKLLSGAASVGIAERLERKGARIVAEPESFLVEDKDGPLLEGEEGRAAAWGRHLAGLIVPTG